MLKDLPDEGKDGKDFRAEVAKYLIHEVEMLMMKVNWFRKINFSSSALENGE